MPKEKPLMGSIQKLYKRRAEDLMMFGYVMGMQKGLPSVSVPRCIEQFMKDFDLADHDYPIDCAAVNFRSMKKEYYLLLRTEQ